MKQKIYSLLAATFLYCAVEYCAGVFFVLPSHTVRLATFLLPILSLMYGPSAAIGGVIGCLAINFREMSGEPWLFFGECTAAFVTGYLPYKLWHAFSFGGADDVFALERRNLLKFIGIIAISVLAAALVVAYVTDVRTVQFGELDFPVKTRWGYCGIIFLLYFNIILLFAMPLFFILISYDYHFYRPCGEQTDVAPDETKKTCRHTFVILTGFFWLLFVLLDVSGVIYDLDMMDTYLQFNNEILTMMNVTLAALMYMLLKYRNSIMTNLIVLELVNIFVAAFLLGTVSFAAISGIINEHVENDLQKMIVIYRERLSHTFTTARLAINSMNRLALSEFDSEERMRDDAAYRQNYLATMERDFVAINESSVGSIGFYMQLSPAIAPDAGFICTRSPVDWGGKMPPFEHQATNEFTDRFHVPYERYLATISEPYRNEKTGRYMLSYVVPLQSNGRFIGIVGIDIDFDYIIHEIRRMSVYEHGLVWLIDKNGKILYENGTNEERTLNKGDFYETEAYLSNGVWLKIAAYSHDIYAGRNTMLIHFVVVMLVVVIVASLFSVWLVKKGISPLMLITDAAKKISVGDLNVNLSYPVKNELGILVESIKEMAAKLDEYVYHDKMTGLLNTAAYVRVVDQLEEQRNNEKIEFAVAVFDANYLKKINDSYGHEAGNELIICAANLIKRIFAASKIYRIGGDEFVAILQGEDYGQREKLLRDFDAALAEEYFAFDGQRIKLSVARGIAVYEHKHDFAEVFREADADMYKNKTELKAARE